jgi:basic amino acid/polyamine antiporter, APA family
MSMTCEERPGYDIGRWSLAALMVNIVIGGGIFGLPSTVAGILGGQSPIAYLIAAAGIGVIAASVAEVASRFQQAGGPYLYAKTAFGRFLGLQTGWLLWLTRISASAAVANVFIDYLSGFWPQAKGPATRFAILTLLIGGLAAANIRGVKTGTWFSNFFHHRQAAALVASRGGRLSLYLRSWQPRSAGG